MIASLLLRLAPWRLAIEAAVVLALVVGIYAAGHRAGAVSVQAKWDAAEVARVAAEEERKAKNEARGDAAATTYEAATAAIKARHAAHDSKLREALGLPAPVAPAASGAPGVALPASAPTVGELRVPAAAVRELRRASGRGLPPEPAARDLGRAMRGGAGVPGPAG